MSILILLLTLAAADGPAATLSIEARSVTQDMGAWQVDYALRYDGPAGVDALAGFTARVDGWVSNSRVPGHSRPRHSAMVSRPAFSYGGCWFVADAVHGGWAGVPNDDARCAEALIVMVHGGDLVPGGPGGRPPSLAPGGTVRVRLRLEHRHGVFGDLDPLLGRRDVEIAMAGAVLRDVLPADRERYLAVPACGRPSPPEDRLDARHTTTGRGGLHLAAHIPGQHYYRFPDRPVRYGTKMRLRFRYLIAAGTEGPCSYRIPQYRDTPATWKMLTDGGDGLPLKRVGYWTTVEKLFVTEPEATTLALEFRIGGEAEVGEMWIDEISLEPVGQRPAGGP